jgi:proteic killer suppression protein
MIRSFADKETEKVFQRTRSSKLPGDIQQVALRKLRMVHRARLLADLRVPPANRLQRLQGERAGQHSIQFNDQWRVCFIWKSGDAHRVEITNDH